jgi:hypothetical protein
VLDYLISHCGADVTFGETYTEIAVTSHATSEEKAMYCAEHSLSPKANEKKYDVRGKNKQDRNLGSSELLTLPSSEVGGTLARFERKRKTVRLAGRFWRDSREPKFRTSAFPK